MSIFDVFSQRQKLPNHKGKPNHISRKFRNRIIWLYWEIAIGEKELNSDNYAIEIFKSEESIRRFAVGIYKKLIRLYGRSKLNDEIQDSVQREILAFLLTCSTEELFDFIELSFKLPKTSLIIPDPKKVVDEINEFFQIEKAAYRLTQIKFIGEKIEYPRIVRVEDEIIYKEAIEPVLSVLSKPHFEAANEEFRKGMDAYREGNYADCIRECCNAVESVLKVLCYRNGWPFNEKDTVAPLLKIVTENSKLDPFFQQPLTLIATMRNRLGGAHGHGLKAYTTKPHIAQYAVSSTAAAIVLLVRQTDVSV